MSRRTGTPIVDDQVEYFNAVISNLFNEFVPVRSFNTRYHSPWFNNRIKNLIIERDFAYNQWKQFGGIELRDNFKRIRNATTAAIRLAKTQYCRNKLDPTLPTKTIWNNIRNIGILPMTKNVNNLNPNDLNAYFANSVSQGFDHDANNIPSVNNNNNQRFSFRNVNLNEVIIAFKYLKTNAIGLDNIDLRFLKLILPYIVAPVMHIFNTAITTSSFPNSWKYAKVIPIKKKSQSTNLEDFRPISILPALSKVLERLLYDQLKDYVENSCMIAKQQSGFRSKHSTTSSLLHLTETIRCNIEHRKFTILCLLDFSKAFDTIDYNILYCKLLNQFDFSTSAANFMLSYLTDRFQATVVDSRSSELLQIRSGVPQGSILGPLLFILYINEIVNVPKHCSISLYADDVQMWLPSSKDLAAFNVAKFNHDLELISVWARKNKLLLNPSKTQSIILFNNNFDTTQLPCLYLNGTAIEYMKVVKNLGVYFDNVLSWHNHIDITVSKVYRGLRSLWRHARYTPLSLRERLVKSLLIPIVTYADCVYCNLDSVCRRKLNVAFNACARYIFGLRRYDHVSSFSRKIFGCSLDTYLNFRHCVMMFKILNNLCPAYLKKHVHFLSSQRTQLLLLPRFQTLFSSRCFFIHGIRIWNNLPLSVRSAGSLGSFRIKALDYFRQL